MFFGAKLNYIDFFLFQSTLYASVGENLSPGTTIAKISASDADKDAIFYYIEGNCLALFTSIFTIIFIFFASIGCLGHSFKQNTIF